MPAKPPNRWRSGKTAGDPATKRGGQAWRGTKNSREAVPLGQAEFGSITTPSPSLRLDFAHRRRQLPGKGVKGVDKLW